MLRTYKDGFAHVTNQNTGDVHEVGHQSSRNWTRPTADIGGAFCRRPGRGTKGGHMRTAAGRDAVRLELERFIELRDRVGIELVDFRGRTVVVEPEGSLCLPAAPLAKVLLQAAAGQ